MKRALLPLCLCASIRAQESSIDERAFVELDTPRAEVWLREPVSVAVRVGVERGLLEDELLQLFPLPLDVPVQVEAGWLDGLACAALLDITVAAAPATMAVSDGVASATRVADRVIDGRAFAVVELERRYRPTCVGVLGLEAPTLRFAYASSWDEDFLGNRIPADRVEAVVAGSGLAVRVRALPEEGRPLDFNGAVGRYTVRADASPMDLVAGESLALVLRIEGEGDLSVASPPRLDGLAGFQVLGTIAIAEAGADSLLVTYDLAPRGEGALEVPPIPFSFFDPEEGEYRTVRSQSIPLIVRGAGVGAGVVDGQSPGPVESGAESAVTGGQARVLAVVASLFVGLVVLLLLALKLLRGRS